MEDGAPHKILSVGETTAVGFKLISANSSGAVFQDLSGNLVKIGINNEISTTFNSSTVAIAAEYIVLNANNQYIVNIVINNTQPPVPAIIDTGANLVTLSGKTANLLGINYQNVATKVQVATASENTGGYSMSLNNVRLGSISLSNIDALIIEGNEPEMVLVGMSFLKQLDLQYQGEKLELKIHNDELKNKTNNNSSFLPLSSEPSNNMQSTPNKEVSNAKDIDINPN
jgi:aspartyl protease family protein